jgi:hypothetical protein
MSTESTQPVFTHRERGSAFVAVLLALVLLTVLGLSLVLVTQTEMQVGANERTISRTFYAAESGLHVALAQAARIHDYTAPPVLLLNQQRVGVNSNLADRVVTSPTVPISRLRCNWCPANAAGSPEFFKITHAVTATADRITWDGAGAPPANARSLAQKTLSQMFTLEPFEAIPPPVSDLDKVRF